MEKNQKTQSQQPEEATAINLKDLLYTLLGHWRWFALSLFICLAVALLVSKSASCQGGLHQQQFDIHYYS